MRNNLRHLREAKGWTQADAAAALGRSKSGYIKLEYGERRLDVDFIQLAAKVYRVSPSEVYSATVPVVGYVGAGSEAHYYSTGDSPDEEVSMPPGGNESTVAVQIKGDSLGQAFRGWYAFYDDIRTPPTADLLRKLCVVSLADGRVLVKILNRGSMKNRFHLSSQFEGMIEDVEVLWAAEVRALTP